MDFMPVVVSVALPCVLVILANYFIFKAIRNRKVLGALSNTVAGVFSGLWLSNSLIKMSQDSAQLKAFYATAMNQGFYLFGALLLLIAIGAWLSRADRRTEPV